MPTSVPKTAKIVLPDCPYCSARDYRLEWEGIHDRLQFVPGEWSYFRCNGCDSRILEPFPKAEDIASLYPEVYTFAPESAASGGLKRWLARLEFAAYYRPQNRSQVRLVLKRIRPKKNSPCRLLDIGCGKGLRLLEFRSRGVDPYGLDFQEQSVTYLRDVHGIPAWRSDLESVRDKFEAGGFDAVTAFYVLEHLTEPRLLVKDAFHLLKRGGWFVCAVPLSDSLQASYFGKRWSAAVEAPRHLSLPTVRAMNQLFQEAGFTDVVTLPDSLWACAGVFGLSAFQSGTTTHLYGGQSLCPLFARFLAALATLVALPVCWVENHLLGRPCLGITFGRRPD
jgi:SAM-dependent methyltransferase